MDDVGYSELDSAFQRHRVGECKHVLPYEGLASQDVASVSSSDSILPPSLSLSLPCEERREETGGVAIYGAKFRFDSAVG